MKLKHLLAGMVVTAAASFGMSGTASAAAVLCQDTSRNHMGISDSLVGACLDAGVGNLTGNASNDLFLTGVGTDYELASKSDEANPYHIQYTQAGASGTFSFDASIWDAFSSVAIGFKFGTGNKPDEWFVYSLDSLVSSGNWQFFNVFGRGGGLSHVNLYGIEGSNKVPEPRTLALFAVALSGIAVVRRRRA